MAQTTKSSSSRSTRSRSSSNKATSRNGSSKSASSRNTRSTRSKNGSSATTKRSPRKTTTNATSNGPVAKTGGKVAELASKAKTPLMAGGAALAGIAGGVALKSRSDNRRPVDKLKTRALPKSLRNLDLGKVDLDAITDAAKKIRALGEQVGDVADAAEKTRKKH